MKTLKVKSLLFSLLAIMTVAVFMTSCGQEEAIIEDGVDTLLTSELILDIDNLPEEFQVIELTDGNTIDERSCCTINSLNVTANQTSANYTVEPNRSFYLSYKCGNTYLGTLQIHNYKNYCRTINLTHFHNYTCYDLCATAKMGVGYDICAELTDCC